METAGETPTERNRRLQRERRNPKLNTVSRMAYRMAGGTTAFYEMDKEVRLAIRAQARELYEIGLTFSSAEEAEEVRSDGFLYIIAHPRLPGMKIGRAFNPESRLRSYQTGCPERAYELLHVSPYFEDCVTLEKMVHAALSLHRLEGEWFNVGEQFARDIIDRQSPFRAVAAS